MKVAIHQPNYLPGLNGLGSFWPKARQADVFIILDTVQFSPHGFVCRALLPDGHMAYRNGHDEKGKAFHLRTPYLTIPCKRPHIQPIKDVLIEWKYYKLGKHIRNLEGITLMRSRMQPFIDALRYGEECKNFEDKHFNSSRKNQAAENAYDRLADWNELLIKKLADSLHVGCQWRRASQIHDPKAELTSEQRILFLVQTISWKDKATTYLTGPKWRRYAPNLETILNQHGIKLEEVK